MLAPPALHLARTEPPLCALPESSSCPTMGSFVFSSCARDVEAAFHSFGWSDMPCQGDYFVDTPQEEMNRSATSLSDFHVPPSAPRSPSPDVQEGNEILLAPPPSPTSTVRYAALDDDSVTTTKKAAASTLSLGRRSSKVRFASVLEVRTYEIILGDHPCCRGGMALQCGWHYSEPELVDLDVHEEHGSHRRMEELRLSFYTRRNRLQEVTGMSGSELLQAEYALCCEQQRQEQFGCMMPTVLHQVKTMKIQATI